MSLLAAIPIIGSLIDPLGRIGVLLAKAKAAQASEQNEQLRIAANERVAVLEARRDVLVKDTYGPIARFAFAFPFMIYNAKLLLWDKIFGWGVTDGLSDHLAWTGTAIIAYYFLQPVLKR